MNEFTWTMSKLRLIIENSLDGDDDGQVKTCFKTFCLKVENEDGEFCYQGIKLAKYANAISSICTKDGQRFSLFVKFVAFSNILLLLDTKSWPKDDFVSFSNCEINKLTEHYIALLKKKKKMDMMQPKFLASGPTWRLIFFQCCTTALMNPTCKFDIKYSEIMKWWLSAKTSCIFLRSSLLYLLRMP